MTLNIPETAPGEMGDVIPRDRATGRVDRTGATFTYVYMGGFLSLALAAIDAGALPGDTLTIKYWRFTPERFTLTPEGGGDRTPGGEWIRPLP